MITSSTFNNETNWLPKQTSRNLRPSLSHSLFAEFVRNTLGKENSDSILYPPPEVLDAISKPKFVTDAEYDQAILTCSNWFSSVVGQQLSKSSSSSDAVYTKSLLDLYDILVWEFNSPFLWRICKDEIQSLYRYGMANSKYHAEIAVGTGLFLVNSLAEKAYSTDKHDNNVLPQVTLLDSNPQTILSATSRLEKVIASDNTKIESKVCNILESIPEELHGAFDSVAANFLTHCLHGGADVTMQMFRNAAALLKDDGVFFGSTILGADLEADAENAGPAAISTNRLYNKLGIFGNEQDTFESISESLHALFEEVKLWRSGYCAVWIVKGVRKFSTV